MNKILKQLCIIMCLWIGSIANYILAYNNCAITLSINLLILIILQLKNINISIIIALIFGLYDDMILCNKLGMHALIYSFVLYILSLQQEQYKQRHIFIAIISYLIVNTALYFL